MKRILKKYNELDEESKELLPFLYIYQELLSVIDNYKNVNIKKIYDKALTSKRFKNEFASILKDLEVLGYTNYWKVLNAKDYGIPQNRERVFIVSVRNDVNDIPFSFPRKKPLNKKLKDILEKNVDEKYYLTEKYIKKLINNNNQVIKEDKNSKTPLYIINNNYRIEENNNENIEKTNKIQRIIGIYDKKNRLYQAGSIYNPNGISPTLTKMDRGGNNQPFVLIREGVKKKYTEAKVGDSINISYPNNIRKRGRVGKEISQTILTSPNIATLENANITSNDINFNEGKISKVALLVSEDKRYYMRIRKLTPLECWRLMGFDDEDFYKAKSVGLSNTQLYKQAGNSIVVDVLEQILKELFIKSK